MAIMINSVRIRAVKEMDKMWMNSSSNNRIAPNMITLPEIMKRYDFSHTGCKISNINTLKRPNFSPLDVKKYA